MGLTPVANLDAVIPILQVSSEVKTDIRNAVNVGKEVNIPERELQFNQWSGVGYVIYDPSTGGAGYLISGGLGGAWQTVKKTIDQVLDKLDRIDDLIACLVLNNDFLYLAVAVVVFIFLFPGLTPFHTVVYLGIIIIGTLVLGQMVFQCASQAGANYLRKWLASLRTV